MRRSTFGIVLLAWGCAPQPSVEGADPADAGSTVGTPVEVLPGWLDDAGVGRPDTDTDDTDLHDTDPPGETGASDTCTARDPLDPYDLGDVQDALRAYQLLRRAFGPTALGEVQGDDVCPAFTEAWSGDVRTRTWTGGCTAGTGVRFEGSAVEVYRDMTWPTLPIVHLETDDWSARGLIGVGFVVSDGIWRANREVDPYTDGIFLERFDGRLGGAFAQDWAPRGVDVTGFEQLVERVADVEWHTFSGTVDLRCRSVLEGTVRVAKNEHHRLTGRPNLGHVALTIEQHEVTIDWSEDDGSGCWPVRVDGQHASSLCF